MKKPKVSVFIPTYNRADTLERCLRALNKQNFKNFEVIVVDNHSTDQTSKIVNDYSQKILVAYFNQITPGIVDAANEALKKARGELFVRIDDDVLLSKNWLKEIVETFDSDPKIGGVTGPTIVPGKGLGARDLTAFNLRLKESNNFILKIFRKIYFDYFLEGKADEPSRFFRSGAFSLGSNFKSSLKIKKNLEVDTLEACNWSCRTKLLKKVGGFDEKFSKGLGDYHEADIPFKLRKMGYKIVFNPRARLVHNIVGGKVAKVRPSSFWRTQNFIRFYFRHIKPNNLDKFLRFLLYLAFINFYWVYKFFTSGKPSALGGVLGTPVGLIKAFPELFK